jgi:hypothetical protein
MGFRLSRYGNLTGRSTMKEKNTKIDGGKVKDRRQSTMGALSQQTRCKTHMREGVLGYDIVTYMEFSVTNNNGFWI